MKWQLMDFEIIIFIFVIIFVPGCYGFMWSLLGLGCNCCGCQPNPQAPSFHTFSQPSPPSYQYNSIHSSFPSPYQSHYNTALDQYVQPSTSQPIGQYSSPSMGLKRVIPEQQYQEPPQPVQYYQQSLMQESHVIDVPMRTLVPPAEIYPQGVQPTVQGSLSSYRGPPAASPTSKEELHLEEDRKYSTGDTLVDLQGSEDHALNMLVNELAEEKYKYNQHKYEERTKTKPKQKQRRIKVFRIRPVKHHHEIHAGRIEWQGGQIARYSHEKGNNNNHHNSLTTHEQSLDTFIPIEIGTEPEFASEEPAGAPPNVKNIITDGLDSNSVLRRRFVN